MPPNLSVSPPMLCAAPCVHAYFPLLDGLGKCVVHVSALSEAAGRPRDIRHVLSSLLPLEYRVCSRLGFRPLLLEVASHCEDDGAAHERADLVGRLIDASLRFFQLRWAKEGVRKDVDTVHTMVPEPKAVVNGPTIWLEA